MKHVLALCLSIVLVLAFLLAHTWRVSAAQNSPPTPTAGPTPTVTGASQDASSLISNALEKNEQARSYRVTLEIKSKDPAGNDSVLLAVTGEVNDQDVHWKASGVLAAVGGAGIDKGIEIISVGGTSYLHGPAPFLEAPEDKWYLVPQAAGLSSSFHPLFYTSFLTSDLSGAQNAGAESLDDKQCDIYTTAKKATVNSFITTINGSPVALTEEQVALFDVADTRIYICDDDYLHQIAVEIEAHDQRNPNQKAQFQALVHFSDFDQDIVITPPADAVAVATRTPTAPPAPTATPGYAVVHIWHARYSPDETRIVTASTDKTVRVWDAATGKELMVLRGHEGVVRDAVYSPDGTKIVSFDQRQGPGTVRVWDAATGKQLLLLNPHDFRISDAFFSPDGKQILTMGEDSSAAERFTVRLWDSTTGALLTTFVGGFASIFSVSYSPDGAQILTAGTDNLGHLWDAAGALSSKAEKGTELLQLKGHTGDIWNAAYSPDGKWIVTASEDGTARIWDVATGKEVQVLKGHTQSVYNAAFSPDSSRVVTTSDDRTARIWDAATGKELAVLRGHPDEVEEGVFSPDGKMVVTISDDARARMWDVANGASLYVLTAGGSLFNSVVFSRDGKHLLTANSDTSAHVWDVAAGQDIVVMRAASSSPTATSQPTLVPAQATATAQAAAELFKAASTWKVRLLDPFDEIANDWTVDSYDAGAGKVSHTIVNGKYIWTIRAARPFANRDIPNLERPADYSVSVEARRVSGPTTCGYGVSLRDDYQHYYLMVANDDQTWRFGRAETFSDFTPMAQGKSSAIQSGQVNRIQVIALKETYTLYINDTFIAQVNDAGLHGGAPGIGVELVKAGDVCVFEFDNFEVRAGE